MNSLEDENSAVYIEQQEINVSLGIQNVNKNYQIIGVYWDQKIILE